MKAAHVTFCIDTDSLGSKTDEHIAALWHIAQANPAPIGDPEASDVAERIGREIITRWLRNQPPALWNHQGRHVALAKPITREQA